MFRVLKNGVQQRVASRGPHLQLTIGLDIVRRILTMCFGAVGRRIEIWLSLLGDVL